MAGSFKDATETAVLDHIVSKTSYTMPTTCAVGLYTAAPTDSTTGTEVTNANAYARKDTSGTDWNAAASGSISNAGPDPVRTRASNGRSAWSSRSPRGWASASAT